MNRKLLPGFPITQNQKWSDLMDFYTRALEINKTGWRVLNCFQFAKNWRVNLQMFSENGASTEYFSEYADADTPLEALETAFLDAKSRHPKAKPIPTAPSERSVNRGQLTKTQERRLEIAMGELYFAIRMDRGTGSGNRDDDL